MSSAIVENAAGGLIASQVHGVVGLLVSRIGEEIKLAWGLQKELEELQRQFTRLSWLLQGASVQPITNLLMADWLKKINDVAEDVDNLLDEWSYKALQHRIQTRKRDKVEQFVFMPISRIVMGHKVRGIRKLIGSIYIDATELGIKPIKVAAGEVYSDGSSNFLHKQEVVDQKLFLGREDDKRYLVNLLCKPIDTNSDLIVLGIVGMAGLGKTTLIKHISQVQEVIEFFNSLVIWLVISHTFNLLDVLKRMVEILFGECSNMNDKHALILKLQKKLKEKRYLLILDDIWDTFRWESLKSTLDEIGGSKGTTIIVTSRDRNVVEKMNIWNNCSDGNATLQKPTIYQLRELSKDDSWSLFMARLSDKNLIDNNEKVLIAKRLIGNCGGVPLAIKALGDLLRIKSTIKNWKEIEESDLWKDTDILPSLRLSYDYLPTMALRNCFAYCAIFREDEVFEKHKLIYMWMAQGFLQGLQPYEEMEDKGEEYIMHLLNSSLFQEVEMDDYGNVTRFMIHDLVWSLARAVSKGKWLCSINDERSNEVRHLLVPNSSAFKKEFEHPTLHFLLKCRHLRVLNVGTNWRGDLNWKPLGSLIHLRYFEIALKNKWDVMHVILPDQITKLYHLQTLCINKLQFDREDPCKTLFPEEIGNLVNVRHILANDFMIGMPVGLCHLTALQTLPVINLGWNWGGRISDMGLLTNLRGKLEIHGLSSLTDGEEARSLGLGSKSNLDSIVLIWGGGEENPKADEILEALQPNENLQKLELYWFDGTAFPKWLMGPGSPLINIVSLRIRCCEEADGNLKLEDFICLRILEVHYCKKLTVTFPNNRSRCCKSLEELNIVLCKKVELLDLSLFPQLRAIKIRDNESTNRDNVPVGLGGLPNLRQLETDLQVPADLGEESPVFKSLEELTLGGSKNNGDTTHLPEQLQHLVALQSLSIMDFESVEAIPKWLGKLTSLQELSVERMSKLKHLPPQGVWKSLSNLKSFSCGVGCDLLRKDIKNITGEWFKIAHIPDITPR